MEPASQKTRDVIVAMTVETDPTSRIADQQLLFLRSLNDADKENSAATLESASARAEGAIVISTVAMEATKVMIAVSVYEEQLASSKFVS